MNAIRCGFYSFTSLWAIAMVGGVQTSATSAPAGDVPKLRNVLLLLVDDMGWTGPECFGADLHKTPNINRLAQQAMKFTNAYAACPVCSPSRAAILTGKYPARLHTTDWIPGWDLNLTVTTPKWKKYLDHQEVTLAEALKSAGYKTASIGKWHLGFASHYPSTHGFDLNIGGTHYHSPPRGEGHFLPNSLFPDGKQGRVLSDRLTDEAIKLMNKWKDEPFLIYLPYFALHDPVMGKPDLSRVYDRRLKKGLHQFKPSYAAMTHSVDESIGRLMAALESLELDRNTLIIFTSDNGGQLDHTSNTPLRDGKASCYEGGIRVPLIIKWPGVTVPGSVSAALVTGVDYYPTILEILSVEGDSNYNQKLDGRSLVPLLRNPAADIPTRPIFWHYPHYNRQRRVRPFGAVRHENWKLILFYEDNRKELYNLVDNVGESKNLADEIPDKVEQLHTLLQNWLETVDAQMPLPNAGYDPSQARF